MITDVKDEAGNVRHSRCSDTGRSDPVLVSGGHNDRRKERNDF